VQYWGRQSQIEIQNACRYMCTLKENGRQAGKHLEKLPSASAFSSGRVGLEDPSQMPLSPSSSVSGHMCLPITFINSIDGHQFKRCQRSQLPLTSVGELRPLVLLKKNWMMDGGCLLAAGLAYKTAGGEGGRIRRPRRPQEPPCHIIRRLWGQTLRETNKTESTKVRFP